MLFCVLTTQEALENAVLAYCREAEREEGRQNVARQPFRYCRMLIIHIDLQHPLLRSFPALFPSLPLRPVTPTPKGKLLEIIASLKRASEQRTNGKEGERVNLTREQSLGTPGIDVTNSNNNNNKRRMVRTILTLVYILKIIYIPLPSSPLHTHTTRTGSPAELVQGFIREQCDEGGCVCGGGAGDMGDECWRSREGGGEGSM